jgi:hypothetical protein
MTQWVQYFSPFAKHWCTGHTESSDIKIIIFWDITPSCQLKVSLWLVSVEISDSSVIIWKPGDVKKVLRVLSLQWECYKSVARIRLVKTVKTYCVLVICKGRSQWPRSLRHELSSPARTLGSWLRIQLKAWTSVCIYSVFVLSCVQIAALRQADPTSKEAYRLCMGLRNRKSVQGRTKGQ